MRNKQTKIRETVGLTESRIDCVALQSGV